jgi:hypothetical protein
MILHLLLPVLIAIGNTIEEHIGNTWEHQKKIKSIFPTPPNINTIPPHCMFSWLVDYMQIEFLQLVVTIFSLN